MQFERSGERSGGLNRRALETPRGRLMTQAQNLNDAAQLKVAHYGSSPFLVQAVCNCFVPMRR